MPDQLDLFLDSHALQRAYDVVAALLARDSSRAGEAFAALAHEDAAYPGLAQLATLIRSLADWQVAPVDCEAIEARLAEVDRVIGPAAQRMLGERAAGFVAAFVRDMAVAAGEQQFDPLHAGAHPAALWLRCGEYERAEAAATALRQNPPDPMVLNWLSVSRSKLRGFAAARPTFFTLCLHAPAQADALRIELGDTLLDRDWTAFLKETAEWTVAAPELPRWFPAWYVLRHGSAARDFEGFEFPAHAAARAVQLLLHILPLERARDLRPLAAVRARLRDLNQEFFTLYMADRTVKHA
jgi:hypothetical protein